MVRRSRKAGRLQRGALLAACFSLFHSTASSAQDVAQAAEKFCLTNNPEKKDFASALVQWRRDTTRSIDIYLPYRITPAGEEAIVDIDRAYDDVSAPGAKAIRGVKNLAVWPVLQMRRDTADPTDIYLPAGPVTTEKIAANDELARSVTLPEGTSRLRFDVPARLADGGTPFSWNDGRLTVIGCDTDTHTLAFIGQRDTSYSGFAISLVATIAVTAIIYALAAVGVSLYENAWRVKTRKISWKRCLDPVVLCSGPDLQGSMSRLQILFFSVLVFGILLFIFLRVGLLSAMSNTVLLLLGISAFGAAAAKGADNQKERLSLDNWAWLIKKRWLPPHGIASVNIAKWRDILTGTGSDGFDVYHFQMLVFSLVVGLGLLKVGFTGLATFTVPESLLALLGLSQAVYVTGKIVDQPTVKELDKALSELRKLEDAFLTAAGDESKFDAARVKGIGAYNVYKRKRDEILPMLSSVFVDYTPKDEYFDDGVKNPSESLEPGYPYPDDLPKPG